MTLAEQLNRMYDYELSLDGRAAKQYALLKDVKRKELPTGDFPSLCFFNPGRVRSVMADVSEKTLAERKCFLCPDGLEDKQQTLPWYPEKEKNREAKWFGTDEKYDFKEGKEGYFARVNPFPIFEHHFTISSMKHEPQQIRGHYRDMLLLAAELPEYIIFYNGPRCGASAPDHMHFQAVPIATLPMQVYCETNGVVPTYCPSAQYIHSKDITEMEVRLSGLVWDYSKMDHTPTIQQAQPPCQDDTDMNIISWYSKGEYRTVALFRRQSRPACFFAEKEEERILISPGAVEMSGVAIVSTEESFERLTADRLQQIIHEVSMC